MCLRVCRAPPGLAGEPEPTPAPTPPTRSEVSEVDGPVAPRTHPPKHAHTHTGTQLLLLVLMLLLSGTLPAPVFPKITWGVMVDVGRHTHADILGQDAGFQFEHDHAAESVSSGTVTDGDRSLTLKL